jgi:hypothetical protein
VIFQMLLIFTKRQLHIAMATIEGIGLEIYLKIHKADLLLVNSGKIPNRGRRYGLNVLLQQQRQLSNLIGTNSYGMCGELQ